MLSEITLINVMLCGALLLLSAGSAQAQFARAMVEKPEYEILKEAKDYEIRRYPACIVAEVKISGEENAMNRGFKPLSGYIFGDNIDAEKIAMTSPVTQEKAKGEKIAMTTPVTQEASGDHQVIRFIMPKKYTLENLPKPKNEAVSIQALAARTLAVRRFTWTGSDRHMKKEEAKLRECLKQDGIEAAGEPVYARYDPPWTIPVFRRNEVLIPVLWPVTEDTPKE